MHDTYLARFLSCSGLNWSPYTCGRLCSECFASLNQWKSSANSRRCFLWLILSSWHIMTSSWPHECIIHFSLASEIGALSVRATWAWRTLRSSASQDPQSFDDVLAALNPNLTVKYSIDRPVALKIPARGCCTTRRPAYWLTHPWATPRCAWPGK